MEKSVYNIIIWFLGRIKAMSKEKVERYKQEKANRKAILAREKKKKFWTKVACIVVAIAIVVGIGVAIGYSAHNSYKKYLASLPDYNRTSLVISDFTGINSTDSTEEQ